MIQELTEKQLALTNQQSAITEVKDEDSNQESKRKVDGVKFQDIFHNIQEDKFESSDDGEEKQKNDRLERLGKVAAPHQKM